MSGDNTIRILSTLSLQKKKKRYLLCVSEYIHTYFFLFSFDCYFLTSQDNFLRTLAVNICMDFSIAGYVKGDRFFVFNPKKN